MIDNYKREINYLRVSITDRCNLRCLYCMPKEGLSLIGHQDILSYEEILRVVRAAIKAGIIKVRVTGGEPLVRRGVVEFLSKLTGIDGLQDVSLTTNGILLEKVAEELFGAGVKRINVSLDSLNADKYRTITRVGDLDRVIGGIRKAYRTGFSPIKINVVAIEGFNDDEVVDFARLTLDYPIQVRFIEYMPIGESALENNFAYLSNDVIRERIEQFSPLNPVVHNSRPAQGPALVYKIPDAPGEIGFISACSRGFCSSCNRLRLTADGQLRACLLSDDEVDLKSPLRSGCTDQELEEMIREAIRNKPEGASMCYETHRKKCVRNMSAIGG